MGEKVEKAVRKESVRLMNSIRQFFRDQNVKKLVVTYKKPVTVRKESFFSQIPESCIYIYNNRYYYSDGSNKTIEMILDCEEYRESDILEIRRIILNRLGE